MKKIITALVLSSLLFSCTKDELEDIVPVTSPQVETHTLIPNVKFEQELINLGIDDILDGRILNAKAETVTKLQIEHKGIEDVTGLSAFKNLTWLSLWDNKFTTIDLTKLTKLQILGLSECPLTSIDLSQNTQLIEIAFQHNEARTNDPTYPYGKTLGFKTLDLSKNIKLQRIYVQVNRLTSLDVSMLPNLTDLWIGNSQPNLNNTNPIQSLDLTNKTRLDMVVLTNMKSLNYLNVKGSNPRRLLTEGCSSLSSIIVSSISAANQKYASGIWEKDATCSIVE
jgi:hypothetical protein